jgi:hypothetical protein
MQYIIMYTIFNRNQRSGIIQTLKRWGTRKYLGRIMEWFLLDSNSKKVDIKSKIDYFYGDQEYSYFWDLNDYTNDDKYQVLTPKA